MTTRRMVTGSGPEADQWFVDHGLPWFVPERRVAAHRALHSRHTLVGVGVVALAALVIGVVLAALTEQAGFAPATLVTLTGAAALAYAGRRLGAAPMARWAVRRTLSSLRLLFPMVTRALPLLLLFMTFLFINAEVWQLSATLDGPVLWVTVLLFGAFAVGFLLVRLPEELDHVDPAVDAETLARLCRGTPLAAYAEAVARTTTEPTPAGHPAHLQPPPVHGMERTNLLLVLMVAQILQVLLVAVSVFVFFVLFGGVVMTVGVQEAWTQSSIHALPWASNLSVELVQVSVFLAAFSGLYFTVVAVTDETYRDQFFTQIKAELERAVGVRTVYLRARSATSTQPSSQPSTEPPSQPSTEPPSQPSTEPSAAPSVD